METILRLTGIISEILFITLIFFCWKKEKSFDFKKNTFSHFGSVPKTKKLFNIGLFLIVLIRSIFASLIIINLSLWNNLLIVLFCILAFFGAFVASIISIDKHQKVHGVSARISAVFSVIFILFVGLSLIKNDLYFGIFNLFVFALLSILTIYLFWVKKVSSVFQILFFILIIIWDNIMTLKLFNII